MYFRASGTDNAQNWNSAGNYYKFQLGEAKVAAGGNVMSLLDATCQSKTVLDRQFMSLFKDCSSLTSAPDLPATMLGANCYQSMFQGCTSLISAPYGLPAQTLATECYYEMFSGCTSLTDAPYIEATTLASQSLGYMFEGCTKLVYVDVLFTDWRTDIYATLNWLLSDAQIGKFYCPEELSTSSRGYSTVPENWAVNGLYSEVKLGDNAGMVIPVMPGSGDYNPTAYHLMKFVVRTNGTYTFTFSKDEEELEMSCTLFNSDKSECLAYEGVEEEESLVMSKYLTPDIYYVGARPSGIFSEEQTNINLNITYTEGGEGGGEGGGESEGEDEITLNPISGNPDSENEGYAKLFDGDNNTKWCGSSNNCYVIFKLSESKAMSGYTLVDAEDTNKYYGRHWKAWTIYGANFSSDADATKDATGWTQVDSRSKQSYESNETAFTVSNAAAYTYYKVVINEVGVSENVLEVEEGDLDNEYNMQQMAEMLFTWSADSGSGEGGSGEGGEGEGGEGSDEDKITLTPLRGNPNSENEGYAKLFDGDNDTKWCSSSNNCYVIFKLSESKAMTGYTLVDGEDTNKYTGRHWAAWTIYGANFSSDAAATKDATGWTKVDSRSDQSYSASNETAFTLSNAKAYKYYKVVIDNVGQSSYMKNPQDWDNPDDEYTPVIENNMQQMAEMQFTWSADSGEGEGDGSSGSDEDEININPISGNPNSENEGYAKLFDGDNDTKWCGSSNNCYVIFKLSESKAMSGYTLVDAEDTNKYYGRHWKSWTIYGANFTSDADATEDATGWTQVDSRSNQSYESNETAFTVSNAAAYTYYKVVVDEVGVSVDVLYDEYADSYNNENNIQQMAEIKFTWAADSGEGGSGEGGGSGDEKVVELDVNALQVALERIYQVCSEQEAFYTLTFAYSYSGNDEGTSVCTGINLYRDGDSYDFIIAPTTAGNTIMAPANCSDLFANVNLLAAIDFTYFNTSNVTDMSSMFASCENLTSLTIGNFDMSKVTTTDDMFSYCTKLKTLTMKALPYLINGTFNSQFSGEGKTVNVVLDDNSVVYTGSKTNNLPAATAAPTYTRTIAADSNWGTLVLPFEVSKETTDYTLYECETLLDNRLVMRIPAEGETVPAGTPVFVYKKTNAESVTFTGTGNAEGTSYAVNTTDLSTPYIGTAMTLCGTYTALPKTSSNTGTYFIYNDKFWNVNQLSDDQEVTILPFHAYIQEASSEEGPGNMNAKLMIVVDDETTDLRDLQLDNLQGTIDGKFIENGKVVIVRNGKKYNVNGQEVK